MCEEFVQKREEEAKGDLIRAIHNSEIYELLGFHRVTSTRKKEGQVRQKKENGGRRRSWSRNCRRWIYPLQGWKEICFWEVRRDIRYHEMYQTVENKRMKAPHWVKVSGEEWNRHRKQKL